MSQYATNKYASHPIICTQKSIPRVIREVGNVMSAKSFFNGSGYLFIILEVITVILLAAVPWCIYLAYVKPKRKNKRRKRKHWVER